MNWSTTAIFNDGGWKCYLERMISNKISKIRAPISISWQYWWLVGCGRACAPVRCAHPSFWAHYCAKRCAPSRHRSFAASPPPKKIFQKQNASLLARPPRLWNIIFPAPRLTYRTLLSYAAPYQALLYPKELCCPLLSYWAFRLRCTLLSYTEPDWATVHLTELRCAFLS